MSCPAKYRLHPLFRALGGLFIGSSLVAGAFGAGSVVVWGDVATGGDASAVAGQLRAGVLSVQTNDRAMAALKSDGSVVAWGDPAAGGDLGAGASLLTSGVTKIFSGPSAFVALKTDGSVVPWGSVDSVAVNAATAPSLTSGVVDVISADLAFAALKSNGSVVTWGQDWYGGDSSKVASLLSSGVKKVVPLGKAFAALKTDGSLVVWGYFNGSFAGTVATSGVTDVVSSSDQFAALKSDGSVITNLYGPQPLSGSLMPYLSSGVTKLIAIKRANGFFGFTAFKNDGQVVWWDDRGQGSQAVSGTVKKVVSSQGIYAALMTDGSIVNWGRLLSGNWDLPQAPADSGVVDIWADSVGWGGFEAVKADGSVLTWGDTPIPADRLTNAKSFTYSSQAGCALSAEGSLTAWGYPQYGGELVDVARELKSTMVSSVSATTASFVAVIETPRVFISSTDFPENQPPAAVAQALSVPMGQTGEAFTYSLVAGEESDGNAFFTISGSLLMPVKALDTETLPVTTVRVHAQGSLGTVAETQLRLRILNDPSDDPGLTYGVATFGNHIYTGSAGAALPNLQFGVKGVYKTQHAFAALKKDGSMYVWGRQDSGGAQADVPRQIFSGVKKVLPGLSDFTVLNSYGEVFGWGMHTIPAPYYAVARPAIGEGIADIVPDGIGFGYQALQADGKLYSKGNLDTGAIDPAIDASLAAGCKKILPAGQGYVILTNAGEVVSLGQLTTLSPDANPALRSGVTDIGALGDGFIATKADGSKVAWGSFYTSGINALPASRVVKVAQGDSGGIALLTDGSVAGLGVSVPAGLASGAVDVQATYLAFAVLKADGSVVAWGDAGSGGDASKVNFSGGVAQIVPGQSCFAALKKDGSVVTWGAAAYGGDSSAAAAELSGGVASIRTAYDGFVAIKTNGRIAIWGGLRSNVDIPSLELSVQGRVVDVVISDDDAIAALLKEPPPVIGWSARPVVEKVASTQVAGNFSPLGTPVAGETYDYSLVAGQGDIDNASFRIEGDQLLTHGPLDHDVTPVAQIRVRMLSSGGNVSERAMLVRIDDDIAWDPDASGHHVVSWGLAAAGGSSASVAANLSSGVVQVVGGSGGFAALKLDGSVIGWGAYASTAQIPALTQDVRKIFGNGAGGWAALKADHSLVSWGNPQGGGTQATLQNVVEVAENGGGFAALMADGSVIASGQNLYNFPSVAARLASGVVKIFHNADSFAALKWDGSVVTWGSSGSDSSTAAAYLFDGVVDVAGTKGAYAALKNDGSVVTWGDSQIDAGDSSAVAGSLSSGVSRVFATESAFAALKANGSVVTWGWGDYGGDSSAVASQLTNGVTTIFPNRQAFAALKTNGFLVTWGNPATGGSTAAASGPFSPGVATVVGGEAAFAALKVDGSVVTWGYPDYGGSQAGVASLLSSGVAQVVANNDAFAAVKTNGSVVAWGSSLWGGDASAVAASLKNVETVVADGVAFAALIPDVAIKPGAVSVQENLPANTLVTALTATGGKAGETFTFSLAAGQGGNVTGYFQIVGSQLKLKKALDFELFSEVGVLITATGNQGTSISSTLAVTVLDQAADNWTAWVSAAHLTGARAAASADPDGDGIPNAVEFATGRDPIAPDADGGAVSLEKDGDYFRAEFLRNPAAVYLNPRVQFGSTLQAWSDAIDGVGGVWIDTFADGSNGRDRVVVWIPAGAATGMFVRLAVDTPP